MYQKRAETLDSNPEKDVCAIKSKSKAGSAKYRYDSELGLGNPGCFLQTALLLYCFQTALFGQTVFFPYLESDHTGDLTK